MPGVQAPVSLVGRAVALAQSGHPFSGLVALDALSTERITNYQPYWARADTF